MTKSPDPKFTEIIENLRQVVSQAAEYAKQQEHAASEAVKKQTTVVVAAVRELISRLRTGN
jgi:predicted HAD superfamily Cof-like phosphohydrolase